MDRRRGSRLKEGAQWATIAVAFAGFSLNHVVCSEYQTVSAAKEQEDKLDRRFDKLEGKIDKISDYLLRNAAYGPRRPDGGERVDP